MFNKTQKTKHLNQTTFYEKYALKDKWIRLDKSIEEIKHIRNANIGLRGLESQKVPD